MRALSTIKLQPLRWLWPLHFPLGKLSLLVGEQGAGKSFVALDMAARVSAGLPWPLLPNYSNEAGSVLLLTEADDLPDITGPRLEAAGANLDRIILMPTEPPADEVNPNGDAPADAPQSFSLPGGLPSLEQAIVSTPDCRLVIIDPLSAFLPQTGARSRSDLATIFKQLAALAARTGVAILATVAFIGSTSAATNHRTAATLAAHPGPACVWRVTTNQDDPEQRLLQPIKNNLAPRNAPLPFSLQATPDEPTAKIAWQPPTDPSSSPPAELRTPNSELRTSSSPPSTFTINSTQAWLTALLKRHNGSLAECTIRSEAAVQHIPPELLDQAKAQAHIQSAISSIIGTTYWSLPATTLNR